MLVLLSSQFVGLGTGKLAIRMEKLFVCACVLVLTRETNRTHE